MNIFFILEGRRVGTEEGAVKLLRFTPPEAPFQIRPTIVMLGDDPDESEQFRFYSGNWQDRICVHLIGNLISAPHDSASLIAWYATLGFASFVLKTSREWMKIADTIVHEKLINVSADAILQTFKEKDKFDCGSRFLTLNYNTIDSFLVGVLDRNPSTLDSARQHVKDQMTTYLERELPFPRSVVENVQREIDRLDIQFLKDHKEYIGEAPHSPLYAWCSKFLTLESSDLNSLSR
jgi:hypothetical protein